MGMRDAKSIRVAAGVGYKGWRGLYEEFSPRELESGLRRGRVAPEGCRRAAVLLPVIAGEEPELIYTVRRGDLADHGGQISFPGGSVEAGDESLKHTALREAEEEIHLRPADVEVVGEMEELYIPVSNFAVAPFVGLVDPAARIGLCPDEVDEVFTVTLSELSAKGVLQRVVWEREGKSYEVALFRVGGREIWGATAALTAGLLARLGWEAL